MWELIKKPQPNLLNQKLWSGAWELAFLEVSKEKKKSPGLQSMSLKIQPLFPLLFSKALLGRTAVRGSDEPYSAPLAPALLCSFLVLSVLAHSGLPPAVVGPL